MVKSTLVESSVDMMIEKVKPFCMMDLNPKQKSCPLLDSLVLQRTPDCCKTESVELLSQSPAFMVYMVSAHLLQV